MAGNIIVTCCLFSAFALCSRAEIGANISSSVGNEDEILDNAAVEVTKNKNETQVFEYSTKAPNQTNRSKYITPFELPDNYIKEELPLVRDESGEFSTIDVKVGIFIYALRSLDELTEDITIELDLTARWKDAVIAEFDNRTEDQIIEENGVSYISLDSSYLFKIWWPSIIFADVVSITHPNTQMTIYPNPVRLRIYAGGEIQMVTRLVIKLNCAMDFTYYPADTQTCKIRIRSHASSNNDIDLNWYKIGGDNVTAGHQDVYLDDRTDGSFHKYLHNISVTSFTKPLDKEATFSVLQFSVSFKRKLSFHVLQTFVPSAFLILITWLSFFLPNSMMEVRIGITMTTLLTLTAMFSSIKEYTPQVSYIKAIDIWMLVCIMLVFVTLFEFAVFVWLRKSIEKNLKKTRHSKLNSVIIKWRPSLKNTLNGVQDKSPAGLEAGLDGQTQKIQIYERLTKAADRYGFFFVTGSFVLFNIVFWPWLLVNSTHYVYDISALNNAP